MKEFPVNAVNETAISLAGAVVGEMKRRILGGVGGQVGPRRGEGVDGVGAQVGEGLAGGEGMASCMFGSSRAAVSILKMAWRANSGLGTPLRDDLMVKDLKGAKDVDEQVCGTRLHRDTTAWVLASAFAL